MFKEYISRLFLLSAMSLIPSLAQASPSSVVMEIAGLGQGAADGPFDLPLNSPLIAGAKYRALVEVRDADSDNLNQSVNNFTLALDLGNGNIDDFAWLVTGHIDDSDHTNLIPGVDNFGQVSTDTFTGHSIPTQVLIDAGIVTPLKLAVVYFTAGAAGSALSLDLDAEPYQSGYSTNNSHYGISGVSYNINQGQGLSFSANVIAPLKVLSLADSNDPFSPNGDRYKDTTTISGSFDRIASWKLTIKNALGTIVRSFSGSGSKVNVIWDGKNSKGNILPDGLYTYVLNGSDTAASFASATSTVKIGNTVRQQKRRAR